MNKSAFGALLLAGALAGCSERPADMDEARELDSLAMQAIDKDEQELRDFIAEAKIKDPLFRDAYFTSDSSGERQIVVVRESPQDDEDSDVATFAMGAFAGLAGAALASAMLSPSGSHYSHYKAASRQTYPSEMMRKKKEEDRGAYVSHVYSSANTARAAAAANPAGANGNKLSTSKPAFSNGNSTRSSAYGSSSGG